MKTKHARELRKGVHDARSLIWLTRWGADKEFLEIAQIAAMKRSTYVSYQAFKRTLELAGMVN